MFNFLGSCTIYASNLLSSLSPSRNKIKIFMNVPFWCLNQYQILLRECHTLSSPKEPPEENNYLYVPPYLPFLIYAKLRRGWSQISRLGDRVSSRKWDKLKEGNCTTHVILFLFLVCVSLRELMKEFPYLSKAPPHTQHQRLKPWFPHLNPTPIVISTGIQDLVSESYRHQGTDLFPRKHWSAGYQCSPSQSHLSIQV